MSNSFAARNSAVVSAALFSALSILKFGHPDFGYADARIMEWFVSERDDGTARTVVLITEFLNSAVLGFIVLVFSALLWRARKKFLSLLVLVSTVSGTVLFSVLKVIYAASRPGDGLVAESTWGYPSGHATTATILFLFFAVLFERTRHRFTTRAVFYGLMLCMIMAAGASRVYLGVHWPSDVAGGMLLGVFCISASYELLARTQNMYGNDTRR